jgi:DNA primase
VDVVAVIGRHVELKKSGRTWKGCCIFHGERTPSFHVYPEDKHFKCYGCGEYGDVFKFLQKLQGKEFPEVVRALAAEVGVEIPEQQEGSAEQKARRQERSEALLACDQAARYWSARLESRYGPEGRRYLESRGVKDETARLFRLGLAGTGWNDLARRLASKGVGEPALVRAGLLVQKDGRSYDRFRGRLMFPIAGLDGQVIGFGGRTLPGHGDEKGAKYINTPETLLYKKSRALYGIDVAREAIRKTRSAVLVEGYFDVIGLHQAGVKNAVAVCGTALTPEHVELLKRCDCREVTILFDGDVAGLAAPAKAAEALLPSGLAGKVAVLPSERGKTDPDDFARAQGKAAVEALLRGAMPLSEFIIQKAVESSCPGEPRQASLEQKLEAVRQLKPFLAVTPEGLARKTFQERVAKRLDLDLGRLWAEVEPPAASEADQANKKRSPTGARRAVSASPAKHDPRERVLLATASVDALGLLAAFPQLARIAEEQELHLLFPAGPIADLAREMAVGTVPPEEAVRRLREGADSTAVSRVQALIGPAQPSPAQAERAFRKAILMARIELVRAEISEVIQRVTRTGSPTPPDLVSEQLRLTGKRRDLEKLLKSVERG